MKSVNLSAPPLHKNFDENSFIVDRDEVKTQDQDGEAAIVLVMSMSMCV